MNKNIAIITGALLSATAATAVPQSPSEEFNRFRQQLYDDYAGFKSRILDHYADFLNGEWHEFEPLWEEDSPYTEPKPTKLPDLPPVEEQKPDPSVAKLPSPSFAETSLPGLDAAVPGGLLAESSITDYNYPSLKINSPEHNGISNPRTSASTPGGKLAEGSITDYDYPSLKIDLPDMRGSANPKTSAPTPGSKLLAGSDALMRSNYERMALRIPDPEFAFGTLPGQTAAPLPSESGIINIDMKSSVVPDNRFFFDFYGMESFIPDVEFNIVSAISDHTETGDNWKKMESQPGGVETSRQLFGLAQQLGLNGYLTFRLTEAYVNQKFKSSNLNARMAAVQYLMSNMGYDIRLVQVNDMLTVMMPFDQKIVYSMMSMTANNGRKYTIIGPEGHAMTKGNAMKCITCNLPSNSSGKTSDLRLTGLNLPVKPKSFQLSNNNIILKGEVNENIRQIFHHYPQMPYGDFASSWIDSDLRDNLVEQLREQLKGMNPKEAINSLLALCHYGFQYKTDQEWHGFEKPYFMEENFIYDFNDCEDRAIFFSYLVWNALGLPCQLVQYPGHESATVAVSDNISGYYYDTDGTRFYSADPTYIGSNIGMVMKPYINTSPTIDKQYPGE